MKEIIIEKIINELKSSTNVKITASKLPGGNRIEINLETRNLDIYLTLPENEYHEIAK